LIATCKEGCDDAYTTNGVVIKPLTRPATCATKDKETIKSGDAKNPVSTLVCKKVNDPSRDYDVCTACDIPCATCKGQKGGGTSGDKAKCITCTAEFVFAVKAEETCFVSCPSGYYEVRNAAGQIPIGNEACKVCEAPCLSCITTATTC
jgi:hypothetical protein